MKKILLLLIVIIFMYGCSNEQKQSHINKTKEYSIDDIPIISNSDDNHIGDSTIIFSDNMKSKDNPIDNTVIEFENVDNAAIIDGEIFWRDETMRKDVSKFLYGYHNLLIVDNISNLITFQKSDHKFTSGHYYDQRNKFRIVFQHSREKVIYDAYIIKSKVRFEYSDMFKTPIVIFTWDPTPKDKSKTQVSYIKAIKGCVIMLPIGFDKNKLKQF